MEKINNNKKQKSIMILIVSLSLISVVLLGVVFYFFSSPKVVLLQSISNFTNSTKDIIGESNNTFIKNLLKEDKIAVDSDISIKMNDQELFQIDFSYIENKKDKKSSINLGLNQDDQSLLEANSVLANDHLYFKIKDIMDYYYTDLEFVSLFEEASTEDYEKVLDYFYDSFKKEVKQKDIKKTKEKVQLGSKDKKVTKLSYEINKKVVSNIISSVIDKVLDDETLVSSFSKLSGIEKQEFIDQLKDSKKDLENIEEFSIYYNIYYYGLNNIVMYELEDTKECIRFYEYGDNYEFILLENGNELFSLIATENGDSYDLEGKIDQYSYKGNYSSKNDSSTLKLDITVQGVIVSLEIDEKVYEKDSKIVSSITIGLVGTEATLDISTVYSVGEEIDLAELENAKDFNSMTEVDIENIITNIQNHPFLSSVYELIMGYNSVLDEEVEFDSSNDYAS